MGNESSAIGRKKGTLNGELKSAIALYICNEDAADPWTDKEIARVEECSEQNVGYARRKLGIPTSRERLNCRVSASLARCGACHRTYELPAGKAFRYCPKGHGRIYLSSVRLELNNANGT
jgi:hypothetical protein